MPIPKCLIADRLTTKEDHPNNLSTMSSVATTEDTMMTNLIVPSSPTQQQANKRYFSVHWKDEYINDGDAMDHEEHNRIDTSSVDEDDHDDDDDIASVNLEVQRRSTKITSCLRNGKETTATKKKMSGSASSAVCPIRMSRRELQRLVQKQQDSIRRACQLELHLLNQSAAVRTKRMRMVQTLQRLQHKLDGDDDNDNNNKFVLPPVYQGSSSPRRHGYKNKSIIKTTDGSSMTPMTHAKVIDMTLDSDESTISAAHSVEWMVTIVGYDTQRNHC